MQTRRFFRLVLAATAIFASSGPALANFSVRYDGRVLLQFQTSNGQPNAGALNGNFDYSAIFYYDDIGIQLSSSLTVDNKLRVYNSYCPGWAGPNCAPLSISSLSISSNNGTTPEDFMSVSVYSPGHFGGMPLAPPGRRTYQVMLGDDSNANLSWALFDNATGYAWNSGDGTVSQVSIAVPEPASWVMMIAGFGLAGAMLRRRRAAALA